MDACRAPGGSADVLCSPKREAQRLLPDEHLLAASKCGGTQASPIVSMLRAPLARALTRLHKALHIIIWGNDLYLSGHSDEGEPRDAAARALATD